ncbi:phage tail protein [Algicola sagamiensis]|uniref:phage tail protein n=1 Tax=Algicola sagamiensis TaxID=163869 RepID=UPI00037EE219|nr:phage tail protein [Algicola sagamiensis]
MSQNKLQHLTSYLMQSQYKGRLLAKPGEFDAWIEGGRITPCSKKSQGNGLIAARFYYSGVISIAPCFAPAELVAVMVSFWLQVHASRDDSPDVEFSADLHDDNSVELELTISQFSEDIELVMDDHGPFVLDETRYDFGEQSLWIAEQFELIGTIDDHV